MSDVTRILGQIESGDPKAAEELLPLVYEELRKLAAAKMAQEASGQTLQATALVHEAFVRLVDIAQVQPWDSRRHFFAAAAEAMRRILVENARRKGRLRLGGDRKRNELGDFDAVTLSSGDEILDLDQALTQLADQEPRAAEMVKLRYFAGLTLEETARDAGRIPPDRKAGLGLRPCLVESGTTGVRRSQGLTAKSPDFSWPLLRADVA